MKRLMLLLLTSISMSSCVVYEATSLSHIKFPMEWHGYYDKFWGDDIFALGGKMSGMKITGDYITFNHGRYQGEYNDGYQYPYTTYKIKNIYIDSSSSGDLIVNLEDAYDSNRHPGGHLRLRRNSFDSHPIYRGDIYLYYSSSPWYHGFSEYRYGKELIYRDAI